MRERIVAGNWKMNKNYPEALELVNEFTSLLSDKKYSNKKIILAIPYLYLKNGVDLVANFPFIYIAAQNCASTTNGAYTGEISASMLHSIGVKFVIIGHSERRNYFKEDNEELNNKVKRALNEKLQIIFCCGESLPDRADNKHFDLVKEQLQSTVFKLSEKEFKNIIIAYEPIWAIGTGKTASPFQAQEMHHFIRNCIQTQYNTTVANSTSILYGGSCNAENANELFSQNDIDGGLIGGASLKAQDFFQIVCAL